MSFVRKKSTKKADALAKQVRKNTRALGSKEFHFTRTAVDTTPDTTAVIQNLSAIAEGLDDNNRLGRKIHAEKIEISGIMSKHSVSTFSSYRIVLFRDNFGTTTAPDRADLFENENDFFNGKPRAHSTQKLKRFTILMDKHIVLNETFDNNNTARPFSFTKKLNWNILYTGTAATDEGKNNLWLMTGSDEATNVPSVELDAMFTFSEM